MQATLWRSECRKQHVHLGAAKMHVLVTARGLFLNPGHTNFRFGALFDSQHVRFVLNHDEDGCWPYNNQVIWMDGF